MKKSKISLTGKTLPALCITALAFGMMISSCKKDPVSSGGPSTNNVAIPPPPAGKINPADPNAVTTNLIIDNSTRIKGGLPAAQKPAGDSIIIGGFQKSMEVSAGGELIMPFNYTIMVAGFTYSCREYYIHVAGADSTIKITKNIASLPSSGTMIQRIRIPSRMLYGKFCFSTAVTFARADGSVYQPPAFDVCLGVSAPKSCGQAVSGSEGLTFTNLSLGNVAGMVSVNYDTYTVPDRVDVYYRGSWVAGTGSDPGPIPPQKSCVDVVSGDGFIGNSGSLTFAYDPALSKDVTVVVSGCLNNSTAWDYTVVCPQ